MVDKFELNGFWFMPQDPNNKVAGTLHFTPNEKIVLELIGSFEGSLAYIEAMANRTDKAEDVIWGESSGGQRVTLLNCHTFGSLKFSCCFPMQNFTVQFCLNGAHLKNLSDSIFNKVTVRFPNLTKWVNHCYVKYSIPFKDDRIQGFNLNFEKDDSHLILVQLEDDLSLELEYTCSLPITSHDERLTIAQSYQLQISSSRTQSFWTLLAHASKFKSFLTLGTLNTIGYQTIDVYSPNNFQVLRNGEKFFHPVHLYFNQHDQVKSYILTRGFLFTHDLIATSFETVIRKWFSFDNTMAPILKHLTESINEISIFNTGDFLIVVQALEGYATRFRPDIPKKVNA